MGQAPSGGRGLGRQPPGGGAGGKDDEKKNEKKKWEPPVPTRVGKKKKKGKGPQGAAKIPTVNPTTKCRLRLSRLERIKDYLILEQEFIKNQEDIKPSDEKAAVSCRFVSFFRG
jgi:26S proteasome regulatory subunit T2